MTSLEFHIASILIPNGNVFTRRESENIDSMIWHYGPPEVYDIWHSAGVAIGNFGGMDGEDFYYDIDRLYLSFDLTNVAIIDEAIFKMAAYVNQGVTDAAENMAIGIYRNNWGPVLTSDDWGSIASSNLISNTRSGPFANGEEITWNIEPSELIPGQINYLMIADSLENQSTYSDGNDLWVYFFNSNVLYDWETQGPWNGILPHLLIFGEL